MRYAISMMVFLGGMLASAQPASALTMEEALAAAYETNPQIRAERERLQATDEGLAQANSGYRPTIGATYAKGRQSTEFSGSGDTSSDSDIKTLRVEQPLFRGGGTWSSYQSAVQRVKSGQHELSAVEQNVLLRAAAAYMEVMATSAVLDLARKNMSALEAQLSAANTRFSAGEATRTDVAQSTSRLAEAKTRVAAAEGDLLSALAAYERIIGVRPQGSMSAPERLPELPLSLAEALERARATNPQLLAAVHAAQASTHDVRTSQAALFPRVSLVGSLLRQDGAGANGTSSFDQDKIALEMTIPLYQSGAEYSRIREAKAVARQRSQETVDRRMSIDEAVTQAWEALETSAATIATRGEQVKAAETALDGVKQEHQYGARTVLDVLDAEQELFSARTTLIAAQRDRIVASYNLAAALGQLTPRQLGLSVAGYDPQKHADDVAWKIIGY